MKKLQIGLFVFSAVGLSLLATAAHPYLLNPMRDRYSGGTGHGFFAQVRSITNIELDSVHEDITHAAEACANPERQMDPAGREPICSETVTERQSGQAGNINNPLIRGVWWNDDPNQLLNRIHYLTWQVRMEDAESIARHGRNLRGQSRRINSTYYMQYRSHFGDLQFLHAQAAQDGELPGVTQQRILNWMQFAYAIAIEEIGPEKTLAEVNLPVTRDFFGNQSGWTVAFLFEPRIHFRTGRFGDLALGSMLHVVQDSFAAGHNHREYGGGAGCEHGRVVQFTSYIGQDSDKHGAEDTRAALLRNMQTRFTPLHNPVEASARLITFVRRKADWQTVVEPYLRNNLFCVGSDAVPAGPGDFA